MRFVLPEIFYHFAKIRWQEFIVLARKILNLLWLGDVTHMASYNLVNIISGNGLSCVQRQAITIADLSRRNCGNVSNQNSLIVIQ